MKIIFLILPALFVVSCDVKERKPASSTPAEAHAVDQAPTVFDVKNTSSLVGQKLEIVQPALEAAQIRFRVIEQNGEPLAMTMDYLAERLNFKIKDGVIIEVSKG